MPHNHGYVVLVLVTSQACIDLCIPQGHPAVSLPPAMAHQGPWRHPSKNWVSERGQTWFANWVGEFLPLVYRLYTVINGTQSALNAVTCGVPQGSVLGPLFFALYINDIYESVGMDHVWLFADDTALYM